MLIYTPSINTDILVECYSSQSLEVCEYLLAELNKSSPNLYSIFFSIWNGAPVFIYRLVTSEIGIPTNCVCFTKCDTSTSQGRKIVRELINTGLDQLVFIPTNDYAYFNETRQAYGSMCSFLTLIDLVNYESLTIGLKKSLLG